jgi:GAF domain-containing protein
MASLAGAIQPFALSDERTIPLDRLFPFCSNEGMVDDAIRAETPSAASPATDDGAREAEVLSGLTKLALEMARTFQAQGLAALAAGDLDRAGKAETRFSTLFLAIRRAVALELRRRRENAAVSPAADEATILSELMDLAEQLARGFHARALAALAAGDLDRAGDAETCFSSLFLGIRRAIALKARLRQQREQAQRQAEVRRKTRQDEKDDRRHAVAQGVAQAIAAVPDTDAQERLTADLREKLTEDERIDVDLADTTLPIEALIASLCRALGLPPRGTPPAGGPAAAPKAGADDTGAGPKGQASSPALHRASANVRRTMPAEDVGRPEGERPSGDTGPPATALPRDRRQWNDVDWAGHPGRETERNAWGRHPQMLAHIRRHG